VKMIILLNWYSGIPISRTLSFLNLPITRTKSRFSSSVKHYNFTSDFSNALIFRTNFHFPWRFGKSGFHCTCFINLALGNSSQLKSLFQLESSSPLHVATFLYIFSEDKFSGRKEHHLPEVAIMHKSCGGCSVQAFDN